MQKRIISLIFAIMLLVSVFTLTDLSMPVYAEEITVYSTAEEDLSKADNFNIEEYESRVNSSNNALEIIQIAVNDNNELFIYVFCPNPEVIASSINLHTSKEEWRDSYKNYMLFPCDTNSYLHKYLVEDFKLAYKNPSYINISSIFRYAIDSDNGSESFFTNEVAYKVSKVYQIIYGLDEIRYSCFNIDVIEVTTDIVGFLRYNNGIFANTAWQYTDSFYIAFNTNRTIDNLYEADIIFNTQKVDTTIKYYLGGLVEDIDETKGEIIKHELTIYPSEVSNNGGFLGDKNVWNRIESVVEFTEKEDLTDEARADLNDKQWVLRFYESEYKHNAVAEANREYYSQTFVTNVSILRLKFCSEGLTYNLGVVHNKVTPDSAPDSKPPSSTDKDLLSILYGDGNFFNGSWLSKLFGGNSSDKDGLFSNLFGGNSNESGLFSKIITIIFSIFLLVLLVAIIVYLTKLIIQLFKHIGKKEKKKGKKNEKQKQKK